MRNKTYIFELKKIFLVLVLCFLSFQTVSATDSCDRIVPQYAEFIGEITFGVNIRSYPCVNKSVVLRGAKTGEQYKIISKVDGWYKIKFDDGTYARIRDKAIKKVGELTKEDKGTEIIKKEYILTSSDYKIINSITSKISKIVNDRGYKYKDIFVDKLQKLLITKKRNDRFIKVINAIIKKTKKISLKESSIEHYNKYKIDIKKVKDYWLKLHNDARKKLGVGLYSYDDRLDNTAYEWSMISLDKGTMEHKRNYGDASYDYHKIEAWFQERGVKCKVKNRVTSSESIGKFGYYCRDNECTDEFSESIKKIFDVYMAEKGKSYDLHYRAITHASISKMGIGIAIEKSNDEGFNNYYDYYITTHYCSEFK